MHREKYLEGLRGSDKEARTYRTAVHEQVKVIIDVRKPYGAGDVYFVSWGLFVRRLYFEDDSMFGRSLF